jgi:hypothetical protein
MSGYIFLNTILVINYMSICKFILSFINNLKKNLTLIFIISLYEFTLKIYRYQFILK